MKKRHLPRRTSSKKHNAWVPFLDTSIFPDILSFRCVHGPWRFFLQIEIILALLVVIGTCFLVIAEFV